MLNAPSLMARLIHTLSLFVLLAVSQTNNADTGNTINSDSWNQANIATANEYIIPRYQQLMITTEDLHKSLNKSCKAMGESLDKKQINTLQEKLSTLYLRWASVQHIHFGPMGYLKRKERFQFWPDKHNSGSKQIRRLLNNQDTLPTVEELARKSVAIQGLPALESIIFSKRQHINKRQCLLAATISQNLANIARNNYDAWNHQPVNFAAEFDIQPYHVGIYQTPEDIANIFFNSIMVQLQIIDQLKLYPSIKKANKPLNTRKLEAWKSQLSIHIIETNIQSLKAHYQYAFQNILQKVNSGADQKINNDFDTTLALLKTTQLNRNEIETLRQHIATLRQYISQSLKEHLSLSSSFNSLDGD